jgi:hypothetical protein
MCSSLWVIPLRRFYASVGQSGEFIVLTYNCVTEQVCIPYGPTSPLLFYLLSWDATCNSIVRCYTLHTCTHMR